VLGAPALPHLFLVEGGAEAIGVSLLWSFRNDTHERRLQELVRDVAGDLFVTTSSELVPRHELTLTLVCDHRILYGAVAARQCLAVVEDVEADPALAADTEPLV